MQHYGLIGEKLGHSLSVPIHNAIFERLGLDADYRLIEIPKETFEKDVHDLFCRLDGFNVTIPYKQRIIPLLDDVNGTAQTMGAVNTVICREGRTSGANTDAPGFAAMLRYHHIEAKDMPCFILGTGGASKAVAAALKGMGAKSVTFVSRSRQEGTITYEELPECFSGLLVNCTPAGMFPHTEDCPISEGNLKTILEKASGVADVIYNPAETKLTMAAGCCGVPCCTGLYMLIDQAVEAERLWQSVPIPDNMAETLMKELKLI